MIKYLEKDFHETIKGKRLIVDFYADWCGPCRMMGEVLETINDIEILKVNVDKFPSVAQEYGVMSIPTIMLVDDNKVKKMHTGFMNSDELQEFIK